MFNVKQQKIAYNNLPLDIQDLIMSNDTSELVLNMLKESGLNDNESDLADTQILYAMYCLQTLDESIKNISDLSKKPIEIFSKLKIALEENIFSKYKDFDINIGELIEANKKSINETISFVPEIRPTMGIVTGGGVITHTPPVPQTIPAPMATTPIPDPIKQFVQNIPVEPITPKPIDIALKQPAVASYSGNKDPYREPLE
jgi:hypothetical protein